MRTNVTSRRWFGLALFANTLGLTACATSSGVPAMAALEPCVETDKVDAESCRAERLGEERLGELMLGAKMKDVIARLGPPTSTTAPQEEGATGDVIVTSTWPGIEIDSAQRHDGAEVVRVNVQAPFAGKTLRGIGIGSTEAEVVTAYLDTSDPRATVAGESFVAGSLFGGLIFSFTEGRVSSMFLGAAAE